MKDCPANSSPFAEIRRIDEGAHYAIHRKESGGRLLPAGVVAVVGTFAGHQAIKLFVRRRKRGTQPSEPKSAEVEEHSPTVSGACTPQSKALSAQVSPGLKAITPLTQSQNPSNHGSPMTQPQTPNLYPTLSISSSITSLEPLGQGHRLSGQMGDSLSMSNHYSAHHQMSNGASAQDSAAATSRRYDSLSSTHSLDSLTNSVSSLRFPTHAQEYDPNEWEDIEVGKGLALYNSMEIDRLRGCKR